MRIPRRCALCGCMMPGWDAHHLLWGTCEDCREWQAYLWRLHPPQPVDVAEVALRPWIAEALAEALAPYLGERPL